MILRPTFRGLRPLQNFQILLHTQYSCQSQALAITTENPLFDSEPSDLSIVDHWFDEFPQRDLSHNNHLLFEYSRDYRNVEILNLFLGIRRSGSLIDGSSLSCILKVCGCLSDQIIGKQVHCHCIKSAFVEDVSVGTSLVDMYMKTENIQDGKRVFEEESQWLQFTHISILSIGCLCQSGAKSGSEV